MAQHGGPPNANLTHGITLKAWAGPAPTTQYGQMARDFTSVVMPDVTFTFPPLLRCITVDVCAMRGYPCGH